MKVTVDARGLECPKPVIKTKQTMDQMETGVAEIIVDNNVAKENVVKYAKSNQFSYDVKESDANYIITIEKSASVIVAEQKQQESGDLVILVGKNTFGDGSEELGQVLIKGYFYTLTEVEPLPKAVLFVNSGAQLTCEGSPALEHIKTLESKGVEISTCGTCLDYYNLKDKMAVGTISNMYAIVEKTNRASNTVRI